MKNIAIIFCTLTCLLISLEGFSTVRLNCPGVIDLGCNPGKIDIPKANKLEYDTDCKSAKVKIVSQISTFDSETCMASLLVTYEAEDKCGDKDACTITINWIEDTNPPVFEVCPQGNIGCINTLADLNNPIALGMKISDNCGVFEVSKTYETITKTGDCTYQAQQQWQATDNCGNSSSCYAVFSYYFNSTLPVITSCPADTFLGCALQGVQIPPANLNDVKFQGGCSAVVKTEFYDIYLDSCLSYVSRYFIVSDQCGNADTCVQKISWSSDIEGPTFINYPNPISLGCNPDVNWDDYDFSKREVIAEDNCGDVRVKYLGKESWQEDCQYGIVYTWEATDICGNSTKQSSGVRWEIDTIPPSFQNCPIDINLGNVTREFNFSPYLNRILIADDNCGFQLFVPVTSSQTEQSESKYKTTVTWIITDDCGNTTTCKQIISYTIDETAPTITSCPPDTIYGCVEPEFILPPADLSRFQYEDETAVTAQALPDQIYAVNGCTYVIKRVYTATDAAGNSSFCEQFIQYTPSTFPTWDYCPADVHLGCHPSSGIFDLAVNDAPVATSPCGPVTITKTIETSNQGNDCEDSIFQQWEATDVCGNTIICSRTIRWSVDRNGPLIRTPDQITNLGCRTTLLPPEISEPQLSIVVEDNCGYTIKYLGYKDENFFCSHKRTYTWLVSDGCGNSELYHKIYNYTLDNQSPIIISCPSDYEYSCIGGNCNALPTPFLNQVKYEDDCDVTVTMIKYDLREEECKLTYTYYYQAEDQCGNKDICTQEIIVWRDSFPPIFSTNLTNVFLGCGGNPYFVPDPIIEAEDCSEFRIERLPDENKTDGCRKEIIQKWRAIDRWGNQDYISRSIIYIDDIIPPLITYCPPDTNLGQLNTTVVNIPDLRSLIRFNDPCGASVNVLTDSLFSVDGCTQGIKRTYEIIDLCGNRSYCSQNFFFNSQPNPLTWDYCPTDIDFGCNTNLDIIDFASQDLPVASNSCGDVEIKSLTGDVILTGCKYSFDQVWTARDSYGNEITCERTITYRMDDEAPMIEVCPTGIRYGCVANYPQLPEFNPNEIFVSDGCGELTFSYHDEEGSLSNCTRIVRRTIIVTDACGNKDVCTQDFLWTFIEEPFEEHPYPEDLMIYCGEVPPVPEYEMRNCGVGIPVLTEEIVIGECQSGNCTVIRLWNKEGCFGFSDRKTQIINMVCDDFLSSREDVGIRNIENFQDGAEGKVKVFPNPGVDKIHIELVLTKESPYHIIMRNTSGQIIQELLQTENHTLVLESFSTSLIPPGIYFVEVRAQDFRAVSKWIKSK
jgi:hypothetical protein